jgi:hypothetical protein
LRHYANRNVYREWSMRALLISMAVGAVLAVGAGFGTGAIVAGVSNGQPANSSIYNYGQR